MARLKVNFKNIVDATVEQASAALEQTADDVVSIARQFAPVDTGALRRSYRWERKIGQSSRWKRVIVGSSSEEINPKTGEGVDYAKFVEYGTVNMMSRPHFTPAFAQAESIFRARLAQALNKFR